MSICSTSGNELPETDNTQLIQDAKTHYIEGNYNLSLKEVEDFIKKSPDNVSGLNLKGLILLNDKSYDEAEIYFLQALNFSPQSPDIYYNLGLNSFNNGDMDKAAQYFNHSITLAPEYADAYFYQGLVEYNKSEYQKAITSFTRATEIRPDDSVSWVNLGMVFEKEREFDNAIKSYDIAIEKDPTYAKAWFLKGLVYNSFGNSLLASSSFENVTRLEPKNDQAWFWYAQNLKRLSQINASVDALNTAITIDPENQEYQKFLYAYQGMTTKSDYEFLFTPISQEHLSGCLVLLIILSLIAFLRR